MFFEYFVEKEFFLIIKGIKIILIFVIAFLFNFFCSKFLRGFISRTLEKETQPPERNQKIKTVLSIVLGTTKLLILISAILISLSIMGIDIGPILASMGLLGLALSLGAREIVADFLAGILILLENEYNVGDFIKIDSKQGFVKEITLRKTVLEDEEGFLHSIPNAQIKIISKKKIDGKHH